ncbi:M3 family metallopeptidase [Novosphingobium sp. Gsoil 351]|uniref:M3 family metallopeptidase n=1 Tax=Novosphingobium sp. Gsoil 351 TaxID=2675225 RepID=UPI0018A842F6|nr:M3 family metallopeptidase [Novosphingobium sp. Gsoil 351]
MNAVIAWAGPLGGLPPFGSVTPGEIEAALEEAMAAVTHAAERIGNDAEAATFDNSVLALELALTPLRRAEAMFNAYSWTAATPDMADVRVRMAARLAAFDATLWTDRALFERLSAVELDRDRSAADHRLLHVLKKRFVRRGVSLSDADRARLKEIEQRLAELQARFAQNLSDEEQEQATLVDSEGELHGMTDAFIAQAAALAERLGAPGKWAIANTRISVNPALQGVKNRDLRRRVRELWARRGENEGPYDNRPLISEIAALRTQKARLLGYPSFAHYQLADKMAGTPEAAMAQLRATWGPVLDRTRADLAEIERLAAADGVHGALEPSDYPFYAERLREARFALDSEAIKDYLSLDNVLAALFDAMGRLHGLTFAPLPEAPRLASDIRCYEVRRQGAAIGAVWFDVIRRVGKQPGSWQQEVRPHAIVPAPQLPLSLICSSLEPQADGTVKMGWDYANVLFHEFGHALHMLLNRAPYESLGPMGVEWDMIELPSQLNERWLLDRNLLRRHAKHCRTGEVMPDAMIDAIVAAQKHRRVTSAWLEYLAPAIVDLELHSLQDVDNLDPLAVESRLYAELEMPAAIDALMRLPHQFHSFAGEHYAAALYSYLWADVLVADTLQLFMAAPGGLYDADVAEGWRHCVLTVGSLRPGAESVFALLNRSPDPQAFLRRFDLV